MTLSVPEGPEDITEDWLTAALGRPTGPVAARRIGQDQGFSGGALYRLHFGAGETLIAKFPPIAPGMRTVLAAANRREVAFYADLAAGLPVPDCALALSDNGAGKSILLLEDLRDHRARSFVRGWTPAEARAVVRALAQVHARWWDTPEALGLAGRPLFEEFDFAAAWAVYPAALAMLWPDLSLPRPFLALGDVAAADPHGVFGAALDRGGQTVLHRDCHADNVRFGADGGAILLDWQIMGRGAGAWDLCYALTSSLPPATRRACEGDLVHAYAEDLRAFGVTGFDARGLWTDYCRAVVAKLLLTVVATTRFDNQGAAKAAWRRADLVRLLAFCADHSVAPSMFAPA